MVRESKGKFFVGNPEHTAGKKQDIDNLFGSRPGIQPKSWQSQQETDLTTRPNSSAVESEEELKIERQRRRELEAELAYLKEKKPLNYYEILPGFRVKRWFVIILIAQAIFWSVLLNFRLTENQIWLVLGASGLWPLIWMSWMQKVTGISYFDD
jgi:hypothetical protein